MNKSFEEFQAQQPALVTFNCDECFSYWANNERLKALGKYETPITMYCPACMKKRKKR